MQEAQQRPQQSMGYKQLAVGSVLASTCNQHPAQMTVLHQKLYLLPLLMVLLKHSRHSSSNNTSHSKRSMHNSLHLQQTAALPAPMQMGLCREGCLWVACPSHTR